MWFTIPKSSHSVTSYVSYGSGDLCKQRIKTPEKANEFYKRAHDARKNMFLCPGPAEEPSTIEDDANTTEAKGKGKGGYMSTIEGDANTTEAKDKGKGAAPSPASAMGKYHNLRKAHLGGVHSPIGQMPIDFNSEAECAYFLMGYGEPHAQPKHTARQSGANATHSRS